MCYGETSYCIVLICEYHIHDTPDNERNLWQNISCYCYYPKKYVFIKLCILIKKLFYNLYKIIRLKIISAVKGKFVPVLN
jgi:hypothetical protein